VLGVGELGGEPSVIKRPRKKMKWIPSSNPLPQSFKVRLDSRFSFTFSE